VEHSVTRGVAQRQPRVLCATDLSPGSAKAAQRAAMLMQRLDAQMLLLHVVDETQSTRAIRHRAEQARISLYWQVRKLARMDSDPQTSVLIGKPHQAIARVAMEWGADLIVLGAYRRRFGDKFLGTTAERVIQASHRPVLIVNRQPTGPYAEVLLATDRSESFPRVARLTQELGLLEGAQASIVHALEPPDPVMFYSAGLTDSDIQQYLRHIRKASSDELLTQLDTAGLDSARFSVIQRHASPFHAIEHAVEQTRSNLLVIGARRFPVLKRMVAGSVSNDVLRKITCDVLIVSSATVSRAQAGTPAPAETI
jgi:nucleotide-binding universal stress UspA family protein